MKKQILVNTSKNFRLMELTSPKDLSELNLAEPVIFKLYMDLVNIDDFQKHLSFLNLAKLDEIKNEREKIRFIKTRGLVNSLFSLDNIEAEPIWQQNKYGKPYIAGWNKDFSISHSTDISVVGLASEAIGVDIEDDSRDIELEKFKRTKFLNFDEGAYESKEEFLMRFTALEAYLKYIGKGFHKDARTISVRKVNDGIVIDDGGLIKAEVIMDGGYTISMVMNKKRR
ncbi:4'-phosphopantetheinyl transferase family protein [Fenollaria massiliensis]|uniref:4'-phosphopantetheinyl transferase family protein n=1 Tax=Fenollaria massiliensis TaxID=938288 RepID=UPI0003669FB7|nr:4'-phosphopantetheinyl transferase superfamily protein [Fenollaria massiliensis]